MTRHGHFTSLYPKHCLLDETLLALIKAVSFHFHFIFIFTLITMLFLMDGISVSCFGFQLTCVYHALGLVLSSLYQIGGRFILVIIGYGRLRCCSGGRSGFQSRQGA